MLKKCLFTVTKISVVYFTCFCMVNIMLMTSLKNKRVLLSDKSEFSEQSDQYTDLLYLDPPSKFPYKLYENYPVDLRQTAYKTSSISYKFIHSILEDLFSKTGTREKFFVEAGALDGEYLSNTLYLEKSLNWTGLLVEADSTEYKLLRAKNRKAWTSNTCLAASSDPYETYIARKEGKGQSRIQDIGKRESNNQTVEDYLHVTSYEKVMCLPVETLLKTLGISHVTFFSLDVEGSEIPIIKNFPFETVLVDVWAIEHNLPQSKLEENLNNSNIYTYEDREFVEFMEGKGYYLMDMLCHTIPDYVFVRRKSVFFKHLQIPEYTSLKKQSLPTSESRQILQEPEKKTGPISLCNIKGEWKPEWGTDISKLRSHSHWPNLKYENLTYQ